MKRVNTEQERLNNPENPKIGGIGVQTIFTAILAFAITFTLNACGGSNDDPDDPGNDPNNPNNGGGVPFNENSQVYNYHYGENDVIHIDDAYNGNGIIKIIIWDEDRKNILESVNAGSVTSGIVALNLPPTIPSNYLTYISLEEVGCADDTHEIYAVDVDGFTLANNDGEDIGRIGVLYRDERITEGIIYWYFSKAGKLICNYEQSQEGRNNSTLSMDIDAKAGWNKIYYHWDNDSNYAGRVKAGKTTTKNILTKELKWTLQSRD
jgi:hypothetical protein